MNTARKAGLAMLLGYALLATLLVTGLVTMVGVDCSGAWCAPWLLFEVAVFIVSAVVLLVAGAVLIPAGYAFLRFGRAGSNFRVVVRRGGPDHRHHHGHDSHGGQHHDHRGGAGGAGAAGGAGGTRRTGEGPSSGGDVIDVEAREIHRD